MHKDNRSNTLDVWFLLNSLLNTVLILLSRHVTNMKGFRYRLKRCFNINQSKYLYRETKEEKNLAQYLSNKHVVQSLAMISHMFPV